MNAETEAERYLRLAVEALSAAGKKSLAMRVGALKGELDADIKKKLHLEIEGR